MRRVLVTGGRDWTDRARVFSALDQQRAQGPMVVVHGDCPDGADALAQEYHLAFWRIGVAVDRHPADWERPCDSNCYHKPRMKNGKPYCPMAGHLRNQQMVDLGADVCLAFPMPDSRGTWDCVRRAKAAGIPVRVSKTESVVQEALF